MSPEKMLGELNIHLFHLKVQVTQRHPQHYKDHLNNEILKIDQAMKDLIFKLIANSEMNLAE